MSEPNRKPQIAIPVPSSQDPAYNDRCLPEYAAAIEAVGGEPVRIALTLNPPAVAELAAGCDAVLLPGSPADVHPQKYGQDARPETMPPDLAREAVDELLLQDAFHLRKPLLGICFGLQMMNVWRGGSLVQHLESGHTSGGKGLVHGIAVQPEASLLRSFFLDQAAPHVNSAHHQAVENAGDGLRVAALAEADGVVEAVESVEPGEHFLLGVQWHPERSYADDAPSRAMFTAFLAAARRWRPPNG